MKWSHISIGWVHSPFTTVPKFDWKFEFIRVFWRILRLSIPQKYRRSCASSMFRYEANLVILTKDNLICTGSKWNVLMWELSQSSSLAGIMPYRWNNLLGKLVIRREFSTSLFVCGSRNLMVPFVERQTEMPCTFGTITSPRTRTTTKTVVRRPMDAHVNLKININWLTFDAIKMHCTTARR